MKVFVDWGITKPHRVIKEDSNKIEKITTNNLNLSQEAEIYLEAGCPKHMLYQLIEDGHRIFLCPSEAIKIIRDELGLKKSDKLDVNLVCKLHRREPGAFSELEKPDKDDIKFKFLMGKYRQITKDLVSLKNRRKAVEREYGSFGVYEEIVTLLEKEKKDLLRKAEPLMSYELSRVRIKGIGQALMARLLSEAHPKNFSTLSKYLIYCGYKGITKVTRRYNREAKSIGYLMCEGTMRAKNPKFYPLYLKIKENLKGKYPDYPRYRINNMTKNRVATLILKDIWQELRNVENLNLKTSSDRGLM